MASGRELTLRKLELDRGMASCPSSKALTNAMKRIPGTSINRIKVPLTELGTFVYSGCVGLSVWLSSDTQTLSPLPSGSDISQ